MEEDIKEIQTYKTWCELLAINHGLKIIDADGFRNIENFSEDMEFTREEFNKRLFVSTLASI